MDKQNKSTPAATEVDKKTNKLDFTTSVLTAIQYVEKYFDKPFPLLSENNSKQYVSYEERKQKERVHRHQK